MSFIEWCMAHQPELIIIAGAVAVVLVIIGVAVVVHRRKKKSEEGKIYKTTDGFLGDRSDIKKPRNVAVVEQRKDDGAVAVVKIYSQEGKNGSAYIANLVLTPEEHKALTENSIVGSQVFVGVKTKSGEFKPIFTRELTEIEDKLTDAELKAVKKGVHNDTPQHRKTYESKMKRWRKHFRK